MDLKLIQTYNELVGLYLLLAIENDDRYIL